MDEAGQEDGTPTPREEATAVKSPESVLREYNRAARLGRAVFRVACDRTEKRLTPYLDSKRFPKEDLTAISEMTAEVPPTPKDIREARGASLAISLEAAAQIAEVHLAQRGPVRENLESLRALASSVQGGRRLSEQLLEEDSELVLQKAREAIARRSRKRTEEIDFKDAQLVSWVNDQFGRASTRLNRTAQALQGYLGR